MMIRMGKTFRKLARSYDLQLKNIESYDSVYKKNVAFRAETDQGDYLIKPYVKPFLEPTRHLRQLTKSIEHLMALGYPQMPKWRLTKRGKIWKIYKGKRYYVTQWVQGRELQSERDYEELGNSVAHLHSLTKGLPGGDLTLSSTRARIRLLKLHYQHFQQQLKPCQQRPDPIGRWFRRHGEQCAELAEEAWYRIRKHDMKPLWREERAAPSIVHGDITVPNVIICPDGLYLVDWDRSGWGSTYEELVKLLLNTTNYQQDKMKAVLSGYEFIKPLQPIERILIGALYRVPREALYVVQRITKGKSSGSFKILKETWKERLEAIRWIDQWVADKNR
ncbi:phosphotransferase [Paenibacillus sp. RC67]|uniref:phosphotransferase n=1 Tax=Paenibacillus sp. RC67 TaxID=3039392 RepID=UPI0024AD771C|nr:phosphotransferase [Paenibacillus sp. RC67]